MINISIAKQIKAEIIYKVLGSGNCECNVPVLGPCLQGTIGGAALALVKVLALGGGHGGDGGEEEGERGNGELHFDGREVCDRTRVVI